MPQLLLFIAIMFELVASTFLKLSDNNILLFQLTIKGEF